MRKRMQKPRLWNSHLQGKHLRRLPKNQQTRKWRASRSSPPRTSNRRQRLPLMSPRPSLSAREHRTVTRPRANHTSPPSKTTSKISVPKPPHSFLHHPHQPHHPSPKERRRPSNLSSATRPPKILKSQSPPRP